MISFSPECFKLIRNKSFLKPLDQITLKGLKFYGKHGYYDEERKTGNNFELDVKASGYFKESIKNDDLTKTFNYELVEEVAREVFSGKSEKLIEKLCFLIGETLFEKSPEIKLLVVSVRKLNPPIKTESDYAEIMMEWKR